MRNLVIWALFAVVGAPASAQTCPATTQNWGDPWPADADIDRRDAEKIRCALAAALRSNRVESLPIDVRAHMRSREVGPTWSDAGRPRIGAFWVSQDGDEVVLERTLFFNERMRLGLIVRLRKRGERWVVTAFNHSVAHARRPTKTRI